MSKCYSKYIVNLLRKATPEERWDFAVILEYSDIPKVDYWRLDWTTPENQKLNTQFSKGLVEDYFWKFQTPLGYIFRKSSYDEICIDVAQKLKYNHLLKPDMSCWDTMGQLTNELKNKIIEKLKEEFEKMSPEEKEQFIREFLNNGQWEEYSSSVVDWAKLGTGAAFKLIQEFGGFATYRIAAIVANQMARVAIGRGLTFAANAALMRGISVALGPIGWLLLAWGINDLLGTNYKKIIPATFFIYAIYTRLEEEKKHS
jgi:uncharacterized protein YaaW (UPF0174 family)